jgi:hypothetical protein
MTSSPRSATMRHTSRGVPLKPSRSVSKISMPLKPAAVPVMTMLRDVLAAEASQAVDIEHRDHPVLHLDQAGFLQHLQSLTDPLPRCTDEMAKLLEISMRPSRLG